LSEKEVHDSAGDPGPIPLPNVKAVRLLRTKTGVAPMDNLLGGGFVPGSSVLLIGPPGAGKSTLLMQLLESAHVPALYVTAEESLQQVKLRADRMNINTPRISLLFETDVHRIISQIERMVVKILVIDSIQTIYTGISTTLPGSATQIRKCAYALRRTAHSQQLILLLIGQVTKERQAAGPKLLEHAVDVVLALEFHEGRPNCRLLQSSKNRFGSAPGRCTLEMTKTRFEFL
jgi:DNA repair protein RadA/Sms